MKQEAPQPRRSRTGIPAIHGGEHVNQLAFAELIESGALDRHIRRMRRRYRQRRDALVATLGRDVPMMPLQASPLDCTRW